MPALSELEKKLLLQPGIEPDTAIEDLAERLSIEGEVQPPVDLALLASLQSIADVRQTVSAHAGCLINEGGRLRIEVCMTDSPARQNFTIAHEICHTLLPGFQLVRNFRCNPGRSMPRDRKTINVEWLADVGASELLLPRRYVNDAFAQLDFGLDAIEEIAALYGASLEATARRYVRLSAQPAFFVRLEMATSRTNPIPELRVKSASWSPGLNTFIPPNKSNPRTHPIFAATAGEYVDAVSEMSALKLPGLFRVSARPYPYRNQEGETVMRVLTIGTQSSTHAGQRV